MEVEAAIFGGSGFGFGREDRGGMGMGFLYLCFLLYVICKA